MACFPILACGTYVLRAGRFRFDCVMHGDATHFIALAPVREPGGKVMPLKDKKGLIIGIANSQSVAYGCAKAFARAGASLAVTYLNAKAEPYVRPLGRLSGRQ